MNITVYDLWKNVLTYGEVAKEKNLDTLDSWKRLRNILSKYPILGKWKIDSFNLYNQINDLGLIDENQKNTKKDNWEKGFLYIQHGRIPIKNKMKPTLLKLLQISFNAGQLRQLMINQNDKFYNQIMRDFYLTNALDQADTYMEKCVLDLMTKEIDINLNKELVELNNDTLSDVYNVESESSNTNNQTGGSLDNYQSKYLKYKSKYLNLKYNNNNNI